MWNLYDLYDCSNANGKVYNACITSYVQSPKSFIDFAQKWSTSQLSHFENKWYWHKKWSPPQKISLKTTKQYLVGWFNPSDGWQRQLPSVPQLCPRPPLWPIRQPLPSDRHLKNQAKWWSQLGARELTMSARIVRHTKNLDMFRFQLKCEHPGIASQISWWFHEMTN